MANSNNNIEMQIAEVDGDDTRVDQLKAAEYEPTYKVYANAKVPVSKAAGTMWQNRYTEVERLRKSNNDVDRWDEAIRYYQNDQSVRGASKDLQKLAAGNEDGAKSYSTENIVFANTSALVPAMYAKNPDISLTTSIDNSKDKVRMFEKLLNRLIKGKFAPCLNLKPKMKKLVVLTNLTNLGYLYLSFVEKEMSSEAAMIDIEKLSEELANAKAPTDIERIEGELAALDAKINLLEESGFKIKTLPPHNVHVDPASTQADLSDARFVIITEYLSTSFIEATYGKREKVDGEPDKVMSIYQPTHVLNASAKKSDSAEHENENDFTLFTAGSEHSKYGYNDNQIEEYMQNRRTKVAIVWDKLTRRVLMYNTNDWTWPIWVWDDPLAISRFFPVFPLTFVTDPIKTVGSGEVVYYLDQQDEINRINNERARMREWAASKVFVDKNSVSDPNSIMEFLFKKTGTKVFPLDLPEGKRITDIVGTFAAPSTQFEQLYDTSPLIDSINRLSSVTPVMRNVEFKTNTTNKAIDTYQSSTQMRLDEKIDALEELIGDVAYAVLEIAVQKFDQELVVQLVGKDVVEKGGGWQTLTPDELANMFVLECVGGSTLKPTSAVKKDQAMNLSQVLGQFASASPHVVLIMLRIIERAFKDDYVVTDGDWRMVLEGIEQQIMGAQQPQNGQQPPQQGGQQPQNQAQQGGEGTAEQVAQIVDGLPQEAKDFLAQGIQQGVPLIQLVQQIMSQMQGQPQ